MNLKPLEKLEIRKIIEPKWIEAIDTARIQPDKYCTDQNVSSAKAMESQQAASRRLAERIERCSVQDLPKIVEPIVLLKVKQHGIYAPQIYLLSGYVAYSALKRARRGMAQAWMYEIEYADLEHIVMPTKNAKKEK